MIRYIITPDDGDWEQAHFELRFNDFERPFHLVMRRDVQILGLNSLSGGEWGEERQSPVPDMKVPILIERTQTHIRIMAGEVALEYPLEAQSTDQPLSVAAHHMQWRTESGEQDTPLLTGVGSQIQLQRLPACGRVLALPEDYTRAQQAALLLAALNEQETYLQFVTTCPIVQADETLTILDIAPTPYFAICAAILFPEARILHLSQGADTDAILHKLIRDNQLSDIQLVSEEEITAILATITETTGPVLLQGAGVFDRLGDQLNAFPDGLRHHQLSIWTTSDTVVPGHRVFPCANAQIRVAPHWTLNHNRATDLSGRRAGLDIAVAAYNAGSYLSECVESLLYPERDDIRIIVVDDGSTDGSTDAIATRFASNPRLRVECKPNGGCASARNYGRLVSDATHIAFVDADDFVSPGLFADLYDLALYSGCEVTQAGFDFYDETRNPPYYPSYEEDLFAEIPRSNFGAHPVIRLQAEDIIKGQPSIWRKVYRRDFLDARNISFPENVRAYDDYIFQLLSLTAARDILMLPEHKYHYRQHPAQDIKQGDERHFYMLHMFHMLLRRSVDEGWSNFRPYAESAIDSITWSSSVLRPDLIDSFLHSSAQFCVTVAKVYGRATIEDLIARVGHPDFLHHYRIEHDRMAALPDGAFWSHFNFALSHPDTLSMRHAMKKAI